MDLTDVDLPALESLALTVARACGALITDQRPAELAVATKSSATDVVTEMDRRSEELARSMLAKARPDDGFLGEEGEDTPARTGITWVVDPIDGTVNYLYGRDAHCVSVAAVAGDPRTPGQWQPIAGAVVAPTLGHAWVAHLDGGARKLVGEAESRLALHDSEDLAQALVATGFAYVAEVRREQAEVLLGVLPQVRDIRRAGSAALDLCHVAEGTVDAYYERGGHVWDYAAASLVVTEAGGITRGVGESAATDPYMIAGGPLRANALDALLRSCGA